MMNKANLLCALIVFFSLQHMYGSDIKFSADKISMATQGEDKSFSLVGNAVVENQRIRISADEIIVTGKDSSKIEAKNNVNLIDNQTQMNARGFHLSYNSLTNYLRISGSVELEKPADSLLAKSTSIEILGDDKPITMRGSVRIYKGNLFARADSAIYNDKMKQLQLIGNTYLIQDGQSYNMDRTTINLKTNEISIEGGITGSMSDDTLKIGE